MPIYEYLCEECNNEIEVIQKISDPLFTECPSCQKHSLIKKTSLSAFHLKGGGWYKDGYGKEEKGKGKKEKDVTKKEKSSEGSKKNSSTTESKSSSADSAKKPASIPATTSKTS